MGKTATAHPDPARPPVVCTALHSCSSVGGMMGDDHVDRTPWEEDTDWPPGLFIKQRR